MLHVMSATQKSSVTLNDIHRSQSMRRFEIDKMAAYTLFDYFMEQKCDFNLITENVLNSNEPPATSHERLEDILCIVK